MSSNRLRIALKDHRRESVALANALHAAGHEFVPLGAEADVLLIDLDPPLLLHKDLLDRYGDMGAKIIIYPHGAGGPILSYEGLFDPDPRVDANLVSALGQAEFFRRTAYPAEVHVIGSTHCEPRPFRACADVKDVLFAPTHPNGDGSLIETRRVRNGEVFAELLKGPWNLTVRHIGTLEQNGLWKADGVRFINAMGVAQTTQIDAADVVVAGDGTFPTLAITRGTPTVMYDQHILAWGMPGEEGVKPRRPQLYHDYIHFPFDVEDGPLDEVIAAAATDFEPARQWRRRFVGEPFDPLAAVNIIERVVLDGPVAVQVDATRSRTTLALTDELLERPELLRAYARAAGTDDDASLLLWTPGVGADQALALAEQAIEHAGVDADALGDVLLVPLPGSPKADAELAARADALLSEWPSAGKIGELPRFAAAAALA